MSSTASPATNPAVRAEPGGHERDGPPTAISPRPGPAPYAAGPRRRPVPCCAAPSRSAGPVTRWRPSPGSSRSTPSPTAVRCSKRGAELGPLSTTRCAHAPARSAGVADKAHHLGPRRRRGRDPVPRAGHGLRQRVGIHRPRRGAVGREPGASTLPPARAPTGRTTRPPSRPEKQPRGAPLRLPATATDADAEHRVPGRL